MTLELYRSNLAVMDACLLTDIPVFLWGPPGTGKTSAVRRWAAERDYEVTCIIGPLLDPTDLTGLPYQQGGQTRFAPPEWFQRISENGSDRHLVFLNELNLSSPMVMNACLRLVLERTVHDMELPSGVRFAAAGNDPSHVPEARHMPASMNNRFAHIEWCALTRSDAMEAAAAGRPFPAAPRAKRDVRWEPIIAAFGDARPSAASSPGSGGAKGRGFPSPRSWEMLARVLPYVGGDEDLLRVAAEGLLGKGTGHEFVSFVRYADLPDARQWLARPSLAHPLERDDQTEAALLAVAHEVITGRHTAKRLAAALDVISNVGRLSGRPSLCQPAIRVLNRGCYADFTTRNKKTQELKDAEARFAEAFAEPIEVIRERL